MTPPPPYLYRYQVPAQPSSVPLPTNPIILGVFLNPYNSQSFLLKGQLLGSMD